MKIFIPLIMALCHMALSLAQDIEKIAVWTENPDVSEISSDNEKENVVGLFIKETYEYYYDTEGNLTSIHNFHQRLRLNNDEAINNFNKLSVSLSNVIEVIEIKARVIKPDGNTIDFDQNNIREIIDENTGRNFKIFAIDGIEQGDDIEYLISRRMNGSFFGRTFFQYYYPVQKASFELISPTNLKYAAKGYNGFPNPIVSELEDGRNKLNISADNIPALKNLKYAYYEPRRARLEYKLEYNLARGRGQILTWDEASQRVYEMMYFEVNPKITKKWTKAMRIKDGSAFYKAAQIEEYIKSNIYVQDYHIPEFSDLGFVYANKVTSERGIVRLYANLFKAFDINHVLVITSDRSDIVFDPDFHSWNYLDKYLIYLADEDTYIDPSVNTFRIGCVDGDITATYGLFIERVKLGTFESAVGKIRYINPTPFNSNYDNMNIEISVDVDNTAARIVNTRGFKGLSGGYYSRIYKSRDEENKLELLKNLMQTKAPNPNYKTIKTIEKSNIEFINDAEFIIFSDFTSTSFIEVAGINLLLAIGESIGPQVELYYQEERLIGGESGYNRWYYRKIIFEVPEGYRVVNPEAADIDINEKNDDTIIFNFTSKHSYTGNIYTVDIDEYYNEIIITPEQFEGFREVVNAAANFNKVVLVLEKI
jgi:hypothetical protein